MARTGTEDQRRWSSVRQVVSRWSAVVLIAGFVGAGSSALLASPAFADETPDAPQSVSAVAGPDDGGVTVSWDAPDNAGSSDIVNYVVTATDDTDSGNSNSPPACAVDGSTTSCELTLQKADDLYGDSWSFSVVAVNDLSETGPAGTAGPATPQAAVPATPIDPSDVTAVPNDGQATISWHAPSNVDLSTDPISYAVTDSGADTCSVGSTDATTASCTVSGLTDGDSYTFHVTATDGYTQFSPGTDSVSVTPVPVPDDPSAITATAGDGQAAVSWSAPSNITTSSDPLSYLVSDGEGHTCTASSPADSCTVSGLTDGDSYTFSVVASDGYGQSSPGDTSSSSVTPLPVVPNDPTSLSATPGDSEATISWHAPSNVDVSVDPLSYTVSDGGSGTCTVSASSSSTGSCTVHGLTNGATYTFSVVATDGYDQASEGSDSISTTPTVVPGAPTDLTATPADGSVALSWNPPSNEDAADITSYTATAEPGGHSCSEILADETGEADTCTITGLTDATSYSFTVTATNVNAQTSAPSGSVDATPAATPTAPTSVSATPGDTTATVSWTAPSNASSADIATYTVSDNQGDSWTTTDASTTFLATDLEDATSYTFTVVANNVNDVAGASSSASAAVTPSATPDAPTNLDAERGTDVSTQAVVSWDAPSNEGDAVVASYTATAEPGGHSCSEILADETGEADTCTIDGLTPGTTYTFSVIATDINGDASSASASDSTSTLTMWSVPNAPTGVAVKSIGSSGTSVILTWTLSVNPSHAPMTGYTATATPGGQSCTTFAYSNSCTIVGLTPGTSYTFAVVSSDEVGSSASSTSTSSTLVAGKPGAPSAPTVASRTSTSLTLSWTAPETTGGTAITGYTAYASPGGESCTSTTATGCTIGGLTQGTTYKLTVVATNGVFSSSRSAVDKAAPGVAPSAPRALSDKVVNGVLSVSWKAPLSTGGLPVTGYTISVSSGHSCTTTKALTCSISGLTPGDTYSPVVTATNIAGSASAYAPTIVLGSAPSAPRSISVSQSTGSVTISWRAPASNGGLPITGYTATVGSGHSCSTTGLSCTITSLTAGTTYSPSVTATNAVGSATATHRSFRLTS